MPVPNDCQPSLGCHAGVDSSTDVRGSGRRLGKPHRKHAAIVVASNNFFMDLPWVIQVFQLKLSFAKKQALFFGQGASSAFFGQG